MDKIELLNISSEINQNLLFYLLKSKNSLTNLGIISKIRQFTQTNEVFTHYTNINAKNFDLFMNQFIKKSNVILKKISWKEFEKFRLDSKKYISFVSSIIILFYMEKKLQKIIKLISEKINKLISYCNSNLSEFNEFQIKIYELTEMLNNKSNYSRILTKHNTIFSENDLLLTPKFVEFKDKEDDINNLKSNLFSSFVNIENNKIIRRDSYPSFSNITFSSLKEDISTS